MEHFGKVLPVVFGGAYVLFVGDGVSQKGDLFPVPLALLDMDRVLWFVCTCKGGRRAGEDLCREQ